MRYIILLFIPFLLSSCFSSQLNNNTFQLPNFDSKYQNYIDSNEEIVLSRYHFVITKLPDNSYRKRVFFPETMTLTNDNMYSDKDIRNKNGQESNYSDLGVLISQGNYKNNKREGTWKIYNRKTGKISQEGEYKNGEKADVWTTYKEGIRSREVNYIEGLENGAFQEFDSLQNVIRSGTYENGEIIDQSMIESSYVDTDEVFKIVEEIPHLSSCKGIDNYEDRTNCSNKTLLKYIYSNIKYPALAREYGIEGQVIVQFVVDEKGDINDIEVVRGICQDMKDECLKVVKNMPKWEPGTQGGEPVKVLYTLPVKFKLE